MYYTAPANPASEWGDLVTLARGMHVRKSLVKLLLHPIVHAYTRKCAANIVEKYERSLVVG